MTSIDHYEEVTAIARVMQAHDFQIRTWKDRLEAIQRLRKLYGKSSFADSKLKIDEKFFKKRWWKALDDAHKFRKEVGL